MSDRTVHLLRLFCNSCKDARAHTRAGVSYGLFRSFPGQLELE